MASLLQKLLSKQSATRIVTTLNKPQIPNLVPPLLTRLHHQPHLTEAKPGHPDSIKKEDSTLSQPLQFYPSFPFGFLSEAIDVVSGDSQTIWADSVKKKRKKKMNRHKYKKLRKRLRRRS